MRLKKLYSHESLITEVSPETCDLAYLLGIPVKLYRPADHLYITEPYGELCLASFEFRRNTDIAVSSKIFCEILMDIKSGMSIIDAYNKQGYTF